MLLIPCGVFYDDFPLFSPQELAADADESASALLDLLGWRHARTGPKGLPFETKFQVLGCAIDLSSLNQGLVTLENKPGRLERLHEHLLKIKTAGALSLHEAQVVHGLLEICMRLLCWEHLHQVCAEIMSLGMGSGNGRLSQLADFCDYAYPGQFLLLVRRGPSCCLQMGAGKTSMRAWVL